MSCAGPRSASAPAAGTHTALSVCTMSLRPVSVSTTCDPVDVVGRDAQEAQRLGAGEHVRRCWSRCRSPPGRSRMTAHVGVERDADLHAPAHLLLPGGVPGGLQGEAQAAPLGALEHGPLPGRMPVAPSRCARPRLGSTASQALVGRRFPLVAEVLEAPPRPGPCRASRPARRSPKPIARLSWMLPMPRMQPPGILLV